MQISICHFLKLNSHIPVIEIQSKLLKMAEIVVHDVDIFLSLPLTLCLSVVLVLATVTKYRRLSGLNRGIYFLQFWSLEVLDQGVGRFSS